MLCFSTKEQTKHKNKNRQTGRGAGIVTDTDTDTDTDIDARPDRERSVRTGGQMDNICKISEKKKLA